MVNPVPVWNIATKKPLTYRCQYQRQPPSETHPSSFALALDLILFDPRALGSDELVAAFVNHAHADLALVTLFAEAPERESVRCETECKT